MGQLELFTKAQLSVMRDRTRARNYSPEADAFRREHQRHRAWGLQQRHAQKMIRLYGSTANAWAHFQRCADQRTTTPSSPAQPTTPATPEQVTLKQEMLAAATGGQFAAGQVAPAPATAGQATAGKATAGKATAGQEASQQAASERAASERAEAEAVLAASVGVASEAPERGERAASGGGASDIPSPQGGADAWPVRRRIGSGRPGGGRRRPMRHGSIADWSAERHRPTRWESAADRREVMLETIGRGWLRRSGYGREGGDQSPVQTESSMPVDCREEAPP